MAPSNKVGAWESLPDAPSTDAEHSPVIPVGLSTVSQPGLVAFYTKPAPMNSSTFFDRYLYPSLLKRSSRNYPATTGSLIRRATDAASRLLIMRDDSGHARLNDSYLSGVLTSAVVQTAYTPYWSRSASTPFSNFGSTMGNDAGLNVFHEFEPDLRQVMTAHLPKFVSRIEQRNRKRESKVF